MNLSSHMVLNNVAYTDALAAMISTEKTTKGKWAFRCPFYHTRPFKLWIWQQRYILTSPTVFCTPCLNFPNSTINVRHFSSLIIYFQRNKLLHIGKALQKEGLLKSWLRAATSAKQKRTVGKWFSWIWSRKTCFVTMMCSHHMVVGWITFVVMECIW